MDKIQRGMSPNRVIAILGEPNYRSFDGTSETLEFRSSEYGTAKVVRVRFNDNKVVEMKSYLDKPYNGCHKENKTIEDKKETKSSIIIP